MTLAPPNTELVAMAWLSTWSGIPAGLIATSLPKDPERPTPAEKAAAWSVFVQVRSLPGTASDPELPERRTGVVQLDFWARQRTSARQPWGAALNLAEKVRIATFRDNSSAMSRALNMPASGYLPARVLGAYLTRDPVRVEGDPSGYARCTTDLAVDWTV